MWSLGLARYKQDPNFNNMEDIYNPNIKYREEFNDLDRQLIQHFMIQESLEV